MTYDQALAIRDQTQTLLDHLTADIRNAQTRAEHQRLTMLTAEAERLLASINLMLAP